MKFLIIVFILIAGCTKNESSNKQELNEQQSQFLGALRGQMDAGFCGDGTYFRTCFSVNEAECKSVVNNHYNSCLPKQVPTTINPQTGEQYGRELGSCIGTNSKSNLRKAENI